MLGYQTFLSGPAMFRLTVFALAVLVAPAAAYIDVGGDRVTFPEVLLEFPHVGVLQVEKLDPDRGAVKFATAETLQGKLPETIKHVLQVDGKLPKELRGLKPGDRVVYFAGSVDHRSIVLTAAGWYITTTKDTGAEGWERYTGMRPDLETTFAGSPADLAKAITDLRAGKAVTVRVRPKGAKPDVRVFLRWDLLAPHHRWPAADPSRAAATARTAKEWAADLKSPDPGTRQQAAVALGELGPNAAADAGKALLAAVTDDVPDVRSAACEAIATVRPADAAPVLVKAIADGDRFVCASAARALAATGEKAAVPKLTQALKDRDWAHDFRPFRGAAAASAVLRLAPESDEARTAVEFLRDRLLNDERSDSYGTRAAGADALAQAGPAAKSAEKALAKRLADADPHARVAAAAALFRITPDDRNPAAAKVISDAVTSPDPLVRLRAVRAVPDRGPSREAFRTLLQTMKDDPSSEIRSAVKARGATDQPVP